MTKETAIAAIRQNIESYQVARARAVADNRPDEVVAQDKAIRASRMMLERFEQLGAGQ